MLSSINCKILSTLRFQKLHPLRTVNKFAAPQPTPKYKPLPCSGNFNPDFRNDRKVIEDGYKLEGMDLQLRFELLDENDNEFMTQYVTEHFVKNSNIVKHLNIKGEEWIELIHPLVVQWISCKNSILAKDGDKIIGAGFGSFHDRQEFNDIYRGELFHDNPKFVIKKDYGEDIRNGPFKNLNLNRVAVLLEELGWQTGKFLPKDTQKLGIHELFSTQPQYMRSGLAAKIANTIQKIFIEQGCTQEAGYCVATGTWKMSLRYGHRTIFSLPYDQYLEDGKPVFENLYDKATAANTTLFDYKRDKFGRRS